MIVQIIIVFIALVLGSITDLDRYEVPDWINFGLIFLGFFIGALLSIIFWDYSYILSSLIGYGIGYAIGWIMYYTGQWGGGDSKMIMGIGAMLGFDIFAFYNSFLSTSNPFTITASSLFLLFLLFTIFTGAIYGIVWSLALIIINRKKFIAEFKIRMKIKKIRIIRYIVFTLTILFLILMFLFRYNILYMSLFFVLAFIMFTFFYLFVGIKIVEKVCMIKSITPEKLTEGDWIAEDIVVDKKIIAGPKDLGISKEQMEEVTKLWKKGKIKKILAKYGIPFVPSFFIAFIISVVVFYLM